MKSFGTSKGFSLTELVISLGISTILASGMGYLIVKSYSENQKAQTNLEVDRFGREIKNAIFQTGKSCAASVSFAGATIPAGTAGPVTVPIRITLPTGEVIQNNSVGRNGAYQIAEAEFARAEFMGQDLGGNSLYQGFVEIRARYGGGANNDIGKTPMSRTTIGTMMARVSPAGNFLDCFTADISADAGICNQLGLEYDSVRGTCRWDMDMNEAVGSNCGDPAEPMVGIQGGSKRCDRPTTDYCLNSKMMTEFRKGRAICSDPPPDLPQPLPPGPAPAPGPVPTPPAPPGPPPTTSPATPPSVNPAPPPGPLPPGVEEVSQPPACSKINTNTLCENFCVNFMFGMSCANLCATGSGANEPCGVVVSNPTPPPLPPPGPAPAPPAPPANPTPPPAPTPPPPAPASSCSCGGTIISSGQYCGYCYREIYYEPDLRSIGRNLPINIREDSYQCNNGSLVYSSVANPNRGVCRGEYETW